MSNYLTRLKVPARPQTKKPERPQANGLWNEIKSEVDRAKRELSGDGDPAKPLRVPAKLSE